MTLGERIRELRTSQGLTQRQLGTLCRVDYSYVSKIENGRLDAPPSPEVVRSLSTALRADELELLSLADHIPLELTMIARDPDAVRFFRRASQFRPSSDEWREMFNYLEQRASARDSDDADPVNDRRGRGLHHDDVADRADRDAYDRPRHDGYHG